jgi:DNA-binding response OmpR family regulator
MHALIIEDEWFIVDAVEVALRQIGYLSFADAGSVREAIAAAQKQCPDLIIANHRLIDGTGTDAVLAICSGQDLPVVFVTASGPEVRSVLPDAIVVSKPFGSIALHHAVEYAQECPFVCPELR